LLLSPLPEKRSHLAGILFPPLPWVQDRLEDAGDIVDELGHKEDSHKIHFSTTSRVRLRMLDPFHYLWESPLFLLQTIPDQTWD
jgi:hypothetical protein